MRKIFFLLLSITSFNITFSQTVGIGTNSPNASAQLDISSTSKGLLIPRMTTAQRTAIASPANGLMVYDTSIGGFYFFNGSAWAAVSSSGGGSSSWLSGANDIYNSNTGNVGIGTATGLKEKLSVKGNLFVTYTNANDLVNGGNRAALNLHGANTGGARVNFLNGDTTIGAYISYYRLNSQLNEFSLNHGSNSRQLSLQENGNVGIGKIGTEKLDVAGNIRSRDNVIVDSNVTVSGDIDADGTVTGSVLRSTSTLTVAQTSALAGPVFGGSTASFTGEIKSSTGITIDDVAGTLSFKAASVDKGFAQLSGDDLRLGTYSSNSTGRLIVRAGGSNRLAVTSDGDVGIGTDAPQAFLHVNSGSQNSTMRLQSDNIPSLLFYQGNNALGSIVTGADFFNVSAPGKLMRLNNTLVVDGVNNRVGIGTPTPDELLHVAGPATVGELHRTQTGSYNMMPVCYGRVTSLGGLAGGTPNITAVSFESVIGDFYRVSCADITTSSIVQVTIAGSNGAAVIPVVRPRSGAFDVKFFSDLLEFEFLPSVIGSQVPFHFVVYNP